MKSYLHLGKPMSTNEAQRTKNVAWAGKWNCSCERREAGRETRQGMQEAKYDFMTVSGVYSIVVTVKKQVVAHSVVNFVGSHNFYRRDDFLSIETLWSQPFNSHEWPRQNSPYNINTISTRWVIRIKKNINLGIIGWSNTKFSELTL